MRLSGKSIIITGSSTGIGETMARRFVQEGARVLLHGRDLDRLQALQEELAPRASLHCDDLADPDAGLRLFESALRAFGRLDGIVNNAAWVVRSNLETTDAELFDRCLAINVRAPLLLIRAAMGELRKREGAVLNIGSMNGYCGEANQLAYSISKGALMTLTRNLADAHGRDRVRFNHFNLGWVLTPNEYALKQKEGLPPDWPQKVPAVYAPSGAIMQPEVIAAAAVYWIGDESRPVSGSVVDLEQYPLIGRNPVKEEL